MSEVEVSGAGDRAPGTRSRVLVVEDEPHVRFGIRRYLAAQGLSVDEVDGCDAALDRCAEQPPDALVLDWRLPDGDAFSLLSRLREVHADIPFVLVTAHGSVELAVRAMREGAEDVLTKPVQLPSLLKVLERILDREPAAGAARRAAQDIGARTTSRRMKVARNFMSSPFIGESRAAKELAEMAEKVAETDRPVLVLGDTGSGKTMLARWIHQRSRRGSEAFVELNCAGLSKELVENELFGHERGAYTGAQFVKTGLIEAANRGTLFLDEVGDLDPTVQPKLLKVLEDQRFRRVGDVRERSVDVRVIAATHHDLARAVREKSFRSDLYYRLSTITLSVPPLRARREDIPALARDILVGLVGEGSPDFSPDAERKLLEHTWPGNVRELKNVLERALLFSRGGVIGEADVRFDPQSGEEEPPGSAPPPPGGANAGSTGMTLDEMERQHIEAVLREEGGRVERAAVRLGIPRSTLYQKIKRFRT